MIQLHLKSIYARTLLWRAGRLFFGTQMTRIDVDLHGFYYVLKANRISLSLKSVYARTLLWRAGRLL